MQAPRCWVSYVLLFQILLMGFTYAWEDISRSDLGDEENIRALLIKRIIDRVRNQPDEFYKASAKRHWVPDVGYSSRGQAGEDVSRRLLAKAFAGDPYGPGRRK